MSNPDDARFRPGGPAPDDDDVAARYGEAPLPGTSAPAPYGAIDDVDDVGDRAQPTGAPQHPAQHVPSGSPRTPDPAPPQGTSPYIGQRPAQPYPSASGMALRPHSARRAFAVVVAAAAMVLLVAIALIAAIAATIGGGDDDGTSSPTDDRTPADGMVQTWSAALSDLASAPDGARLAYNPDGAFTGPQVIAGDAAWVVAWTIGDDYVPAGLGAIDPASGAVLWDRPLEEVVCADQQVDGALLCLARDGATWVYHRIDAVTGEDMATVETPLENVQTVHANGDVLIAVGPADPAPHAEMAGIAVDGSVLWSFDIAKTPNADLLFSSVYDSQGQPVLERPRWRDLDGGLVMLWSTPGVAIIDPSTGATFVHECRAATPAVDHYYCQVGDDLHRYALDGTLTWSSPGLRPAVPEDASDSRLVALREPVTNTFEVMPIDLQTGEAVGGPVYSFGQQPGVWTGIILPPSINAEPDATFLVGDIAVVALDPETGALLWTLPHDHIYVGDIVQIGDVAVMDGGDLIGLDVATGRVLWERQNFSEISQIGDDLVSTSGDEIALLELP